MGGGGGVKWRITVTAESNVHHTTPSVAKPGACPPAVSTTKPDSHFIAKLRACSVAIRTAELDARSTFNLTAEPGTHPAANSAAEPNTLPTTDLTAKAGANPTVVPLLSLMLTSPPSTVLIP